MANMMKCPQELYDKMLLVCRNIVRDCQRWQKTIQPDTENIARDVLGPPISEQTDLSR